MKKVFLMMTGVLLVFGMNSDALANSNTKGPFGTQENHNLSGFEGKVEFVSGRHHRGHRSGHFRGNRHRGHRSGHFRGHQRGFQKRHFGGLRSDKYYRPYYKPYGNYYSGGYSYRGRGYGGYKNYNHRNRGYGNGFYLFRGHKY